MADTPDPNPSETKTDKALDQFADLPPEQQAQMRRKQQLEHASGKEEIKTHREIQAADAESAD